MLRSLLDDRVLCYESSLNSHMAMDEEELLPEEEAAVAGSVEKRKREYREARGGARLLLAQLGIAGFPLLNAPDRSPIWPTDIVGSITHTKGFCGVVVAKSTDVRAVGIDAEQKTDLKKDLWSRICRPEEEEWIHTQSDELQGSFAKLHFSAKESAYKCQYAINATFLGFHDLCLQVDSSKQRFRAYYQKEVTGFPEGYCLEGRYTFTNTHVVCATLLNPED